MKDLKITKGDLVIKNSGTDAFPFYQILEEISEVAATHNLTVAKLIVDSYNTAQKCGLLPSELLKQRDELREALERIANPIAYMERNLKEDERLNGMMAIQISNNAEYLKGIADAAIKNTEG